LDHHRLPPPVDDGETEALELVTRAEDDEFHVDDTVERNYHQVEDAKTDSESDAVDGPGFEVGGAFVASGGAADLLTCRLTGSDSEQKRGHSIALFR
jgi:hypothetical protein